MKLKKNQLKIFFFICTFFVPIQFEIFAQINHADKLITVLSDGQNSLMLEITIPKFEKQTKLLKGKKFDIFAFEDFNQFCLPGKPQLPVKSFLFGIPSECVTSVEILETKFKTFTAIDIYYTPKITYDPDTTALRLNLLKTKLEPFIDKKIANTNQFYPQRIVQLENSAFIREQRVGKLTIFPIQYNPVKKQIRFYEKIKLKINFSSSIETQQSQPLQDRFPAPFEKLLSKSLINYDRAKYWRGNTKTLSKKLLYTTNNLQLDQGDWYKIVVDEDAIYRLNKNDLQNAGIDVSAVDPQKIKIFYRGLEIPIDVNGEADGVFDDSDFVEFYGVATKNEYTYDNNYWLTIASENGRRLIQQSGELNGTYPIVTKSETRIRFEQNHEYFTSIPNGEGEDHWFWNYVTAPNSLDITVNLNNVINISSLPCKLKMEFRGITHTSTNPDHHTIVSINGYQVLNDFWEGQAKLQSEGNFTQGYLSNGSNTVRINLPGDTGSNVDYVYVNWIEILYWQDYNSVNDVFAFTGRADPGRRQFEVKNFTNNNIQLFDITDSTDVIKIVNLSVEQSASKYTLTFQDDNSNRRYLALTTSRVKSPKNMIKISSSFLASKNNQADYLIVTHENFYNSLATLANLRQDQGLKVKTIKVQDIYDEFNYGVKNPQAIKDFISYAYYNWRKPSPTYVLLVGDASFDYKNYWDGGEPDLLPTHLFESSVYNTETASDNWFVCVRGDDVLPDLLIGRLPVRTNSQLDIITSKIIEYENNPEAGSWHKNVVFVADNADGGGNFEGLSDRFSSQYIPQDFNVRKIYLRDYNNNAASTKTAIINHINDGCLIVNYVGHGSLDTWAAEKIFDSNQVSNLVNHGKIPLVVTMSCLNGFFHHAKTTYSLSEEFLIKDNGGAVASFSPSGFGYTIGDQYLGDGLYSAIFNDRDFILGSAILKAKLSLFLAGSSFRDHVSFFNLLGDPALQLNISPAGINVNSEWNLISLPRIPKNPSVENVLSSLTGKWKKLLAYSNGAWNGADADIPAQYWTLKQMEWGQGYWLQTIEPGQIVLTGTEKSSSIPLMAGWNLIGNTTPLNHSVEEAMASISGSWKKLLYYSNGAWFGADASLASTFWTLDEFKKGAGYWLEMSKADTLNISRIPPSTNNLASLNERDKSFISSNVRKIKNSKSTGAPALLNINSEKNYKLSIPKPSGYYGTVFLKNEPVPVGSKISAWISDVQIPPQIIVTSRGKYNLMLLNGDDSQTPQIEGGTAGAQVVFKIQTPEGEVFVSDIKGDWEEGINHRLDLSALAISDSSINPLSIKILVNDRVVGKDILDGDPISNKATISAFISGGNSLLGGNNLQLYLNSSLLDKSSYSFFANSEKANIRGRVVYLPTTLTDGEYSLTIEVINASPQTDKVSENFSFIISNTLKLDRVVNFPNPMQQETKFTYYLLNDNPAGITVKIFTIAGRLIKQIHAANNLIGYNEIYWDGRDEFGDEIANGVYFYKIIARDGSEKAEVIERLVVMK